MGGTDACSIDLSIATSNGAAYKLDVRNYSISKETTLGGIGSSLSTKEGVLPDLGLAIAGAEMEANGFNVQQAIQVKPSDHSSSEDAKFSKRPDIALPCPRCNSLDTKFCYYNNYNVNQPRHFCKDCQRYWTAGGTLRNVAVGAGRRKRKYSSLDSESCTEASSVECCNPQDCLSTRDSFSNCKSQSSRKDQTGGTSYRAGGLFQNIVRLPQMDLTSFVSDSKLSEKMQGNISSEAAWTNERFASQHGLRPIRSSFDIRNQEKFSLEFTQLKLMTTWSGERINPCGSVQHLHKLADNSNVFLTQNEELRDIGGELLLAIPSERQVSNESGCASSLTTQAMSEDACTYGGKSDVDSEISKEGDKRDIGLGVACERLGLTYHDSCKVSGGVHSASQCHVSSLLTTGKSTMQFWKGTLENPEFEATQTVLPVPQFWLSPVDRPGLPWSPPGLPTASAVNAAKAALITNAGVSKKPQPEPSMDMALKIGVLLQKESGKSQPKPTTPEQSVWVPKTSRLQDIDEAARSSIWSTLGIRDKQGPLVFGKTEDAFHCWG